MKNSTPSLIGSIFKLKCPHCRKGNMFIHKSLFPFKTMMDMPEKCAVCEQKMELHTGFYFGTGYVSYALSIIVLLLVLVFYALVFGISMKDNSPYYFLIVASIILVISQPWLMRLSRVIYLYIFVKFDKNNTY